MRKFRNIYTAPATFCAVVFMTKEQRDEKYPKCKIKNNVKTPENKIAVMIPYEKIAVDAIIKLCGGIPENEEDYSEVYCKVANSVIRQDVSEKLEEYKNKKDKTAKEDSYYKIYQIVNLYQKKLKELGADYPAPVEPLTSVKESKPVVSEKSEPAVEDVAAPKAAKTESATKKEKAEHEAKMSPVKEEPITKKQEEAEVIAPPTIDKNTVFPEEVKSPAIPFSGNKKKKAENVPSSDTKNKKAGPPVIGGIPGSGKKTPVVAPPVIKPQALPEENNKKAALPSIPSFKNKAPDKENTKAKTEPVIDDEDITELLKGYADEVDAELTLPEEIDLDFDSIDIAPPIELKNELDDDPYADGIEAIKRAEKKNK